MQTITDTWTAVRTGLHARRARRAADQRLVRELAGYTSQADRYELDTLIARAPEADAERMERIVSRLRAA